MPEPQSAITGSLGFLKPKMYVRKGKKTYADKIIPTNEESLRAQERMGEMERFSTPYKTKGLYQDLFFPAPAPLSSVESQKKAEDAEYYRTLNLKPYTPPKQGAIDIPSTSVSSKTNVAPNLEWMYPQLSGESKVRATNFSNDLLSILAPIPGLEGMGKIPGILPMLGKGVKSAGKYMTKGLDSDIARYIGSGLSDSKFYNPLSKIERISGSAAPVKKVKPAWQLEELPGLHLKSTMSNNPQGLHKYVAKDRSIDSKSALEHLKRMEGDARYDVVLKNMQDKYGANLENLPKRMDYNTLRKDIQSDLWDVGTGKGQAVGDNRSAIESIYKSGGIEKRPNYNGLNYDPGEVNIGGYSFTNKNKFIGGADVHNMPKETLGHVRSFTNPKEPGVYYSAERQSNWAQEAGSTLKKTDIDLLQRQQKILPEMIKEQDNLIKAGNDTWAIGQKERFQSQLKDVNAKIDSYNSYSNASQQEKLVMKNMNERMLQEDVAYAASKGNTKYRIPSEESMAKIQGYSRKSILTPENIAKREAIMKEQDIIYDKFNIATETKQYELAKILDEQYIALNLEISKINKTATLGDYSNAQQTILKHTKQSLKDAENLFNVKLKPIIDIKGNTWYEFDIPKKFMEGKGEIKAFGLIPPVAVGATGASSYLMSRKKKTSEKFYDPNLQ